MAVVVVVGVSDDDETSLWSFVAEGAVVTVAVSADETLALTPVDGIVGIVVFPVADVPAAAGAADDVH